MRGDHYDYSDVDMVRIVACTYCGAKQGERCQTIATIRYGESEPIPMSRSYRISKVHKVRRDKAIDLGLVSA